jgi:hypothetical protein
MDQPTYSQHRRSASPRGRSIWLVALLAAAIACVGDGSRNGTSDGGDASTKAVPPDTGGDTSGGEPEERARDSAASSSDSATGAAGALAVLGSYFGAIDAHRFHDAYHLWSDDGAASGLTLEEFARGYDSTRSTTFRAGTPGRIEGAAGSRYIEIPVTIEATTMGGTLQRFAGEIVLKRVVVPGAEAQERSWRIYSAAIHAVP